MDQQTRDFYQMHAEEWAARMPGEWAQELDGFLDLLAPGAAILELGCGDGRDAARMIARGFDVDPSDGAPEMARRTSERIGRPVPVMRFDQLDADADYEAVWCHASLLHVPLDQLPAILARIHRALRPGGRHFASFKGGTGGGRDQFGRFYSYLPEADLRRAYRDSAAWVEFALSTGDGGSFGGEPTVWHAVTARK